MDTTSNGVVKDSKAKACLLSLLPSHIPSYKINKIGPFLFSSPSLLPLHGCTHAHVCLSVLSLMTLDC